MLPMIRNGFTGRFHAARSSAVFCAKRPADRVMKRKTGNARMDLLQLVRSRRFEPTPPAIQAGVARDVEEANLHAHTERNRSRTVFITIRTRPEAILKDNVNRESRRPRRNIPLERLNRGELRFGHRIAWRLSPTGTGWLPCRIRPRHRAGVRAQSLRGISKVCRLRLPAPRWSYLDLAITQRTWPPRCYGTLRSVSPNCQAPRVVRPP